MRDAYQFGEIFIGGIAMDCSPDVDRGFRIKLSSSRWAKCQLFSFLSLLSIVFANGIQAATIRVPESSATIQGAINVASNGDTVLVAPGTYFENINFQGKSITVQSEQGPDLTIIDGSDGSESVVTLSSGVLSGFTITNGHASFGGGISVGVGSPRIENNIIVNNVACGGAGILIAGNRLATSDGPAIVGNEIKGNSIAACDITYGGAGIFVHDASGVLIDSNRIIGNSASQTDDGGGMLIFGQSHLTITNNIISGNFAGAGGGILIHSTTFSRTRIDQNLIVGNQANLGGAIIAAGLTGERLINNTIVNNDTAQGAGVFLATSSSFDGSSVKNNIIVAEQNQTAVDCSIATFASIEFAFNNVFSPQGSAYGPSCGLLDLTENISANPNFADESVGNYQLRLGSPSIDAGTNLVQGLPATDLNGDPRVVDGDADGVAVIDMGAFEYNGRPIAYAGPDQTVACGSDCSADVTLDGRESYDPDGSPLDFQWTGPFGTASGPTPVVSLPQGQHVITLMVTDLSGYSSSDTLVITVVDTTSPTIASIEATPNVLLQANHQMVPVTVVVAVNDNCDSPVCQVISVTSDEPIDGLGDGDTTPDWEITGNLTVDLRAERSAHGTGRLYTITVQCSDSSGNLSTRTVTVNVPRNN
jgi:nitrous oxidase accessory protein NosD